MIGHFHCSMLQPYFAMNSWTPASLLTGDQSLVITNYYRLLEDY